MFFNFDDLSASRRLYLGDGGLGGTGINWQDFVNQSFALGSQALNSFGGAHTGTQFAQGPQGIFNIANSGVPSQVGGGGYDGGMPPAQQQAAQQRGGLGLDDAAGSFMGYIMRNPLLVGGIVLGAYLLFREPPKRR